MKKQTAHIIVPYSSREVFKPDCSVTKMLIEIKKRAGKIESLSSADIEILIKYGWEVHYKGKERAILNRLGAIYEE